MKKAEGNVISLTGKPVEPGKAATAIIVVDLGHFFYIGEAFVPGAPKSEEREPTPVDMGVFDEPFVLRNALILEHTEAGQFPFRSRGGPVDIFVRLGNIRQPTNREAQTYSQILDPKIPNPVFADRDRHGR
jgi:hypothetical protein